MRIRHLIFAILWIALFSCNGKKTAQENDKIITSVEEQRDILYQEVIAVHDEVMPKMQEIVALQEKLRVQIDSLNEVDSTSEITSSLNEVNLMLKNADDAMMNWMREFKPEMNAKEVENEEALTYLRNEMDRIIEVQKVVNESIENAHTFLDKQ
ncbi:MAG: hypothetical protein OEW67_06515 [Cyclobacteriaceae bacterium]|nr:hypothetical protein [Cyclobacteriaceae bacterium]